MKQKYEYKVIKVDYISNIDTTIEMYATEGWCYKDSFVYAGVSWDKDHVVCKAGPVPYLYIVFEREYIKENDKYYDDDYDDDEDEEDDEEDEEEL